jgi:large subunit ribosomal protein L13
MSHVRFSQPLWHLVDAKNQVVGRLASQVVRILRGKHKPTYCPNYDCGDYVVIINAGDVKFTGDKTKQKHYKWHTGYPGGLKQKSVRDLLQSKPEEVSIYYLFIFNCIIIIIIILLLSSASL